MNSAEVADAVGASSLSEVCWVDATGEPQVRGAVTLLRRGRPVLAFTYADELVARDVAGAPTVVLALSEPRSTGKTFRPLLVSGRPTLLEDPSGDLFVDDLVLQELKRYPPSRLFADSPLLMREHWWYLPRLVVEIDVDAVQPLNPRTPPHDHLLVVADGRTPVVRVSGAGIDPDAEVEAGDRLGLAVEGAPPPPGRAVLFGQDASFPDLERWSQWRYRGTWDGSGFVVEEAPGRTGLAPVPGVLQRWRRQRDLQRRCVQAIPRSRRGPENGKE